jgi:hypothetical protein
LILLDEPVEQFRVALLQAAGDGLGFIAHERGEEQRRPRKGRGS